MKAVRDHISNTIHCIGFRRNRGVVVLPFGLQGWARQYGEHDIPLLLVQMAARTPDYRMTALYAPRRAWLLKLAAAADARAKAAG